MRPEDEMRIRSLIHDVPDFPAKGIVFRDITPLLADPGGLRLTIDALAERYKNAGITKVVGIESRGFIVGAPLAYAIGAGLVLLRKPGKLPRATRKKSYALEYGESELHLHEDGLSAKDKVLVVDDVIATGGTLAAGAHLVNELGAELHELCVLIELSALGGRKLLGGAPLFSLLTY